MWWTLAAAGSPASNPRVPCRVKKTLVLGLGNTLLSDEGVGVRVVERLLASYDFPSEVEILDGGTLGLDLLPYIQRADRLLVVDAVELAAEPGTLVRLEGGDIPSVFGPKLSPHQMGLADLLNAAQLLDCLPDERVLWGCQPGTLRIGLDLSTPVGAQVERLVENVLSELLKWDIVPTTRALEEGST